MGFRLHERTTIDVGQARRLFRSCGQVARAGVGDGRSRELVDLFPVGIADRARLGDFAMEPVLEVQDGVPERRFPGVTFCEMLKRR